VQNELKRTQNEPQLSAEMRASCVEFEVFQRFTGFGGCLEPEGRPWTKSPGRGNPEDRERVRKSWEQSQGVLENKGHHFLESCKYRVFCAQINSNLTPKEANHATFLENEVRTCDSPREGMTVAGGRLDKLGTFIGADLNSGRVAGSYRRIVATGFRMTDFRVDRGRD